MPLCRFISMKNFRFFLTSKLLGVQILITPVIRIVPFFSARYAYRVSGMEYLKYFMFTAGLSPIIRFS